MVESVYGGGGYFFLPANYALVAVVAYILWHFFSVRWVELVEARGGRGWTQEDLAAQFPPHVPVTPRTVQRWESGETTPNTSHMAALKALFNEPKFIHSAEVRIEQRYAHQRPPLVIHPDWPRDKKKR